jgi:hypothetical protein
MATPIPTTLDELFRSLGLALTIRGAADDDDGSWACTLTRPDGAVFEIDQVTFFDVDPETGDEWIVEPTPSRVLSVLAGGDVESEDGEDAGEDTAAAARAFLGDEAFDLLVAIDAGEDEDEDEE